MPLLKVRHKGFCAHFWYPYTLFAVYGRGAEKPGASSLWR
jgi:hypothetical protein